MESYEHGRSSLIWVLVIGWLKPISIEIYYLQLQVMDLNIPMILVLK